MKFSKCSVNIPTGALSLVVEGLSAKELAGAKKLVKKNKDFTVTGDPWSEKRSTMISSRFHGWITFIARESGTARDEVYIIVLKKAIEIVADGGSPYPYVIYDEVAFPYSTRNRTNKEMMTACFACEMVASEEFGIGELPETFPEVDS